MRTVVFGAGPAGLAAAISAREAGAEVMLVEKTDAVGRKLSMTGNGRGNLSNTDLSEKCYNARARELVGGILKRIGAEELDLFLKSAGVVTRAEGSFIYPVSGQASSVTRALDHKCRALGVRINTNEQLKEVVPARDAYICRTDRREYEADTVVIATGLKAGPSSVKATGDALYICEKLGMRIMPVRPALVPLLTEEATLPEKTGVRAWGRVCFETKNGEPVAEEFGELQFTKAALSGIPVLQASGAVAEAVATGQEVKALIDFFPEYDGESFKGMFSSLWDSDPKRDVIGFLEGFLNSGIAGAIVKQRRIPPETILTDVSEDARDGLLSGIRNFEVSITGVGDFKRAQAASGGVAVSEVDERCQSVKHRGLYIAGELLDVVGRCGGYNLHWAFASGIVAGRAAGGMSV